MYDGSSKAGSTNYLISLRISPEGTTRTGAREVFKVISTLGIKANTLADNNYFAADKRSRRFPHRTHDSSQHSGKNKLVHRIQEVPVELPHQSHGIEDSRLTNERARPIRFNLKLQPRSSGQQHFCPQSEQVI